MIMVMEKIIVILSAQSKQQAVRNRHACRQSQHATHETYLAECTVTDDPWSMVAPFALEKEERVRLTGGSCSVVASFALEKEERVRFAGVSWEGEGE